MGNTKSGTLGKLSRRVRRNTERAMKARGKREKAMMHECFVKAFNLGAEMFKTRILNATAGYQYEPTVEGSELEVAGEVVSGDAMSESTLGTQPEPLRHILDASFPVGEGVDAHGGTDFPIEYSPIEGPTSVSA